MLTFMTEDNLKAELQRSPSSLFSRKFENDDTILHFLATLGTTRGSTSIARILELLLPRATLDDFQQKNAYGDTPLHRVISLGNNRVTREYLIPAFIQRAIELNYDFSLQNNLGLTVIHLAAINDHPEILSFLLQYPQLISIIDMSTASGSSALFYAINHEKFTQINILLDAGAHPLLPRDRPEKQPLNYLNKEIHECKKLIQDEQRGSDPSTLAYLKEKLAKYENCHVLMRHGLILKMPNNHNVMHSPWPAMFFNQIKQAVENNKKPSDFLVKNTTQQDHGSNPEPEEIEQNNCRVN